MVQYADKHETVHEGYQMQNETELVVSISEAFEKKCYQQCTMEVQHYYSEVEL